MLLTLLLACTTVITVNTRPEGAQVYITDYAPSPSMPPVSYEAAGTSPLVCEIDYLGWENYYVWAQAPGCTPEVRHIDNEIKLGPAVGGFFCAWPLWIWALGPDDAPVQIDFTDGQP